jgi:hypothetical protein
MYNTHLKFSLYKNLFFNYSINPAENCLLSREPF